MILRLPPSPDTGMGEPHNYQTKMKTSTRGESPLSATPCCVSLLIESALSAEDVKKIHAFGECWIANYNPTRREYWEKALWLYAWEKKVVWQEPRAKVPTGHSPHNH